MKSGLRALSGLAVAIALGSRRHIAVLLRAAPVAVMCAAASFGNLGFREARGENLAGLHLNQIEEMIWGPPDRERERDLSLSYSRCPLRHRKPYTGWEKKFRYSGG